jgi:penicillin-binding protein 1A
MSSSRPPPAPPRTRIEVLWIWTKRLTLLGFALAMTAVLALFLYIRSIEAELPAVIGLQNSYKPPQVTRILARDGSVLSELFTERRTIVKIDTLPDHVKRAVLAAEDSTFYEHEGINYLGILRAAYINIRSGKVKQGGSTITQQVVKNVLLDSERSFKRKMREALLARKLEQELKKDEILELYLNHIYFGHGRYGIEEASKDLFGKSAKELSAGEAALLAGIIACPESCHPRRDLKSALERRGRTLARMLEKGFITQPVFDTSRDESIRLIPVLEKGTDIAPEVVSIARKMLHDLEPERSAQGGFTISTTIDPKMQLAARKSIRDNLLAYDKRHALSGVLKAPATPDPKVKNPPKIPKELIPFEGTPTFETHKVYLGVVESASDESNSFDVRVGTVIGNLRMVDVERYNTQKLKATGFAQKGARIRVSLLAPPPSATETTKPKVPLRMESGPEAAFVAIDVKTRDVLALIGNYEAAQAGLDRATQSRRQPGSTFKPIVYSYALHSRRFTPATIIDVNPTSFGDYKPSNYEGWTAKDPLRLREVLAQSVNIGAVRVLDDVGPQNVVEWAKALGITTPMKGDLSLALGSYEVEPIELCGVYASFAGGGTFETPSIITKITGPDGKDLELKRKLPARRVLDEAEAFMITSMMSSVVDHGTATGAKVLGRPVAGKTGTTNGSKDTWFAGFSTDIAAVSWVGYDDGKLLGTREAGGSTALPAWVSFMKFAHEGRPITEFSKPAGIVTVKIDTKTGNLPYPEDPTTMDEVFLEGTEPTEVSEVPASDAGAMDGGEPEMFDSGLPPLPNERR